MTKPLGSEEFRLTLVDGFAGGGRYLQSSTDQERPGSPLIMLEAMGVAERAAKQRRSKDFSLDVDYFFIEQNADALAYLRKVLSETEFNRLIDEKAHLLHGSFESHAQPVVDFVKKKGRGGRAIFVLDQCGYTDVPLATIRRILSELPHAEVILTIAVDFLIDYLNESEQCQAMLDKLGVKLPANEIAKSKSNQREWRRLIQLIFHREIPQQTCAQFYTPFFIHSPDSHRDLWLVHLSGHYRARDVMVGLHWQESSCFVHQGGSGLNMFGFDPKIDPASTGQAILPGFFFDETARAHSHEQLFNQLPAKLAHYPDGVQFAKFFSTITNETPVTTEILKEVLADLSRQGEIEVQGKKTGRMHKSRAIGDGDLLLFSKQKRLFLPPGFNE